MCLHLRLWWFNKNSEEFFSPLLPPCQVQGLLGSQCPQDVSNSVRSSILVPSPAFSRDHTQTRPDRGESALFLTRPRDWEHSSFLNNPISNPIHTFGLLFTQLRGSPCTSYKFPSNTRDIFHKFKIKEIIKMDQIENKMYFRLSVTLNILVKCHIVL